jgi:putative aldouronate transport system substrate-binding protein
MRVKGIALPVAVLLAAGGMLWASGQDDSAGAAAEGRMVISWFSVNSRGVLLPENTVSEQYVEERFNVELEPWTDVDIYQGEQWRLKMASGEVPDFMKIGPRGALYDLGVVRELPRDWFYQHMPNYVTIVDQIDPAGAWNGVTIEGKIMGLPGVNVAVTSGAALVTRRDWMEAVGVEIPEKKMLDYHYADDWSLEQLEAMLYQYRHGDPDGNGKKDTYAVNNFSGGTPSWGSAWDFFPNEFGAFGVRIHSWQEQGGKLGYSNITPEYRDALKYLNGWYEKEIIDPEMISDGRKEFNQKFTNGIVGAFEQTPAWTGPRTEGPIGLLLKTTPEAEPVYIIGPEGPGGRGTANRPAGGFGACAIGVHTSDEKAIRIMQILDEIQTDMDVYHKITKGDEGTHYSFDGDGLMVPNPEFQSAQTITEMGWMYFTMWNVITPDITLSRLPRWRTIPHRIGVETGYALDAGFRPQFNEELRQMENELRSIENEFFWKVIIGEVDADAEWDAYVAQWRKVGGDELTAEANRQWMAAQ